MTLQRLKPQAQVDHNKSFTVRLKPPLAGMTKLLVSSSSQVLETLLFLVDAELCVIGLVPPLGAQFHIFRFIASQRPDESASAEISRFLPNRGAKEWAHGVVFPALSVSGSMGSFLHSVFVIGLLLLRFYSSCERAGGQKN